MEIAPQDLGEKWRTALLQQRALSRVRRRVRAPGSLPPEALSDRRERRHSGLRRYLLRPARLTESDEKSVASILSPRNLGVSGIDSLRQGQGMAVFLFLTLLSVFMFTSMVWHWYGANELQAVAVFAIPTFWLLLFAQYQMFIAPRRALRRINADPVTCEEIEAFLPTVRGELDRAYLNTLLDTQRQTVPTNAQADLRSALRSLGDTISALPGSPLPGEMIDPEALRHRAQEKRAQADSETDSLVRASLLRQAEAEEKQAAVVEQSGATAKRARARHDEATSQLSTLRSVLAVYASPESAARLEQATFLSDTVRRIAGDATAAAQAKQELDDSELAALYGKPVPTPQARVGITSAGTQAMPPITPAAPGGKWWRNQPGGNGSGS